MDCALGWFQVEYLISTRSCPFNLMIADLIFSFFSPFSFFYPRASAFGFACYGYQWASRGFAISGVLFFWTFQLIAWRRLWPGLLSFLGSTYTFNFARGRPNFWTTFYTTLTSFYLHTFTFGTLYSQTPACFPLFFFFFLILLSCTYGASLHPSILRVLFSSFSSLCRSRENMLLYHWLVTHVLGRLDMGAVIVIFLKGYPPEIAIWCTVWIWIREIFMLI